MCLKIEDSWDHGVDGVGMHGAGGFDIEGRDHQTVFLYFQHLGLNFVAGADFVEAAVADPADAVAGGEHFVVVGGADDGDAFFAVEGFHELDNFLTGFGVEVSGGFIGEDDAGRVGEGSGDGDALLLSAREFEGFIVEPVAEADALEDVGGFLDGVFAAVATKCHREHDILQGAHDSDEVEGLKNVADAVATHPGLLGFGEVEEGFAFEENASLGGNIEGADLVEECGFSGTGGSHDGKKLATADVEGDAFEGPDFLFAKAVEFFHIFRADDAVGAHGVALGI